MSRPWIWAHQMDRNVGVGLTKPHKSLKSKGSTYDRMRKVELIPRPLNLDLTGPSVSAGGADPPGFGEDAVPCVTANVDNVIERVEEAVRQDVLAHELPELFDGVEFRTVGRQPHEGDVVRNGEVTGDVVAGTVDQAQPQQSCHEGPFGQIHG